MPSARTIVFWFLYVVIQWYLLRMYHEAAIAQQQQHGSGNHNGGNNPINSINGMENNYGFELPPLQGTTQTKLGGEEVPTKRQSTKQQSTPQRGNPDGTFNGYPIYKLGHKQHRQQEQEQEQQRQQEQQQQEPSGNNNKNKNNDNTNNTNDLLSLEELYSQFHCVGETWHDTEYHKRSRTHHEQSWMYRSCRFQVLCYDTSTQEYVIYLDPEKHQSSLKDHHYHDHDDHDTNNNNDGTNNAPTNIPPHPSPQIEQILEAQRAQLAKERSEVADEHHARNTTTTFKHATFFDDTSTIYRNHTVVVNGRGAVVLGDTEHEKHYGLAIGSINGKWGLVDVQLLKWFPTVRWGPVPTTSQSHTGSELYDYDVYTLPPSVVMIPFHSLSAENPGHLVWDDLLPMYTLLEMFGFLKNNKDNNEPNNGYNNNNADDTNDWIDLLPIRYVLPGRERGLWAGCDWLDSKKKNCHSMLAKFGTLMGTRRSYTKFHYHEDNASDENNTANANANTNSKGTAPSVTSASKLPRIAITTNRKVELHLNLNLANEGDSTNADTQPHRRLGQSSEGQQQTDNANNSDNENENENNSSNNSETSSPKPKLICAKNALAGFGAISDHLPLMGHGWSPKDYLTTYNSGRGRQLWEFRNYMIHNLFASLPKKKTKLVTVPSAESINAATTNEARNTMKTRPSVTLGKEQLTTYPPSSITDMDPDEPLVVMFSAYSSQRRGGSMESEANHLKDKIKEAGDSYSAVYGHKAAPGDIGAGVEIVIENHVFAKYSLEEQIQMASRTAVFITYCGGGAITASFLPRGGAVQIYYSETGGIEQNRNTETPARLDWDYFNNCGYLHVNWVPYSASTGRTKLADYGGYPNQAKANVDVILSQLRRIHTDRVRNYQRQNNHQKQ
jgi:hypothetical protein